MSDSSFFKLPENIYNSEQWKRSCILNGYSLFVTTQLFWATSEFRLITTFYKWSLLQRAFDNGHDPDPDKHLDHNSKNFFFFFLQLQTG